MRHPLLLLVLFTLGLGTRAHAQWSSNPAANLAAVDRAGEQTQPKLVATGDGGCYLSWFDNDPAGTPPFGYDVYLQRFDSAGTGQWAHNGVLVADRGFSSTTDYDLGVDAAGNALLTFRDDRVGGTQVTAAKLDPTGNLSWGALGVQLTSTTDFVANPKIAGTTDGEAVVAWIQASSVHVQRLDANGATLWSPELVLTPGAGSYSTADLDASDGGSCVLSFVHQTGSFSSPRHLLAQKLDPDGDFLWSAGHVAVFDGGSLQFGNFPQCLPDGAGGAVFAWYSASPALESFAQRLDAGGAELFPHNGVSVSTTPARVRVAPAVSYDPLTQSTYVFCVEENSLQSQFGVTGQAFDSSGARQWGAGGTTLVALGSSAIAEVETLVLGSAVLATWTSSPAFGQDVARAALLDAGGSVTVPVFACSSTPAVKYRFEAEASAYGFGILAWRDERGADPHIYLQDILPDGTLGGRASTATRNGSGVNVVFYTKLSDARLGHNWSVQVSHAHHPGATATIVYGRTNPFTGPIRPIGQVLIGGPLLFSHALPASGSADVHTLPVPIDITFVGLTAYTQAVITGGGLELGNALDVTAGL